MKSPIKRVLCVSSSGAAGGLAFFFFLIFVVGPGQPGQRGGLRAFFESLNAPLARFVDWLGKANVISPDNILVGLLLGFAYWMLLGAVVALMGYGLGHAILSRRRAPSAPLWLLC